MIKYPIRLMSRGSEPGAISLHPGSKPALRVRLESSHRGDSTNVPTAPLQVERRLDPKRDRLAGPDLQRCALGMLLCGARNRLDRIRLNRDHVGRIGTVLPDVQR